MNAFMVLEQFALFYLCIILFFISAKYLRHLINWE